MPSLLRLPYSQ